MKNVIYCRTIVAAKDAPDGETPTQVIVTEENNLYCVWKMSYGVGTELLGHFYRGPALRERALERAVRMLGEPDQ